MWKNYTVQELKAIAVKYNSIHKIAGVAKMKREELIDTLEKITEFKAGKLHIKAAHGGEEIKAAGKPRVVAVYSATGKGGEHKKVEKKEQEKAKIPAPPPTPPKKAEDKSYKKGVVAKKVVQARGASADAKAIKPPEEGQSLPPINLTLLKEGLINLMSYKYFHGPRAKGYLTKFVNEKGKTNADFYRLVRAFMSTSSINEYVDVRDLFKNQPLAYDGFYEANLYKLHDDKTAAKMYEDDAREVRELKYKASSAEQKRKYYE